MSAIESVWSYRDALRAIWERSGYDRGFISNPFWGDEAASLGLKRTAALLDRMGNPHQRVGIVHVAGSKGKGSTNVLIGEMLAAAGYRVGRYTSPHLHTFRERIAVNGVPVTEAAWAALTERAIALTRALELDRPELGDVTAFELTTAMALDAFAAAGCDLATIEVGLGGTLDSTNVVDPLVSVITALDLEHTAVLGDTIEEIAAQKAGIIKPGRPVAVSPQSPAALAVISRIAEENGSEMLAGGRDWHVQGSWRGLAAGGPWGRLEDLRVGLAGPHQVENAGTALGALWLLRPTGIVVDESAIRAGLAKTTWPGRYERAVHPSGARVVLDGAHTPASAAALARTLAEDEPGRRAWIVLGMLRDKDPAAFASALQPVAAGFIATQANSPRAVPSAEIAAALSSTSAPIAHAATVAEAMAMAVDRAGRSGLVVATGSLSIVAEAREALGLGTADPRMTP
jgi:dihydrofolate synthase/folylpolyglutamate synthase